MALWCESLSEQSSRIFDKRSDLGMLPGSRELRIFWVIATEAVNAGNRWSRRGQLAASFVDEYV